MRFLIGSQENVRRCMHIEIERFYFFQHLDKRVADFFIER
jgi:hypothetical protein